MKKNKVFIILAKMLVLYFMITFVSCKKDKTDLTTSTVLKEKFDSLPDTFNDFPREAGGLIISYFQEGGYTGQMTYPDSTGKSLGDAKLKLKFNQKTLLDKAWPSITLKYKNDIVLVIVSSPGASHYSYLFNKGIQINDKVQPESNIPEINHIKLVGDYLYLMYYDRRNTYYTPDAPPMYGRYNLISEELILEGPRLNLN